jgi:hypothetical protein
MLKGSCLCGRVQFEVERFEVVSNCHCSMCRKAHGAAYATFAAALLDAFRYTAGEDQVATYPSAPDNVRCFCRTCGSNLPKRNRSGQSMIVPLGCMDDDPGLRPMLHIFAGSKAPWHEIRDELPCFEEWVPGFGPEDRET